MLRNLYKIAVDNIRAFSHREAEDAVFYVDHMYYVILSGDSEYPKSEHCRLLADVLAKIRSWSEDRGALETVLNSVRDLYRGLQEDRLRTFVEISRTLNFRLRGN